MPNVWDLIRVHAHDLRCVDVSRRLIAIEQVAAVLTQLGLPGDCCGIQILGHCSRPYSDLELQSLHADLKEWAERQQIAVS